MEEPYCRILSLVPFRAYCRPSSYFQPRPAILVLAHASSPGEGNEVQLDDDQAKRLELLSWSIKLADETAPFGHINGAELEISGYMIQTTKIPVEILAARSNVEVMLDFDFEHPEARILLTFVRKDCYCLLLGKMGVGTVALLLKSLVNGSFIRLGIIVLNDSKSVIWSLEDAQRRKIRLL